MVWRNGQRYRKKKSRGSITFAATIPETFHLMSGTVNSKVTLSLTIPYPNPNPNPHLNPNHDPQPNPKGYIKDELGDAILEVQKAGGGRTRVEGSGILLLRAMCRLTHMGHKEYAKGDGRRFHL